MSDTPEPERSCDRSSLECILNAGYRAAEAITAGLRDVQPGLMLTMWRAAGNQLPATVVPHPPPRAPRPLRGGVRLSVGRFRRERIAKAVERFLDCGDCTKGIARIRCTNPDCTADYFRPFSRKVFRLCPSCSQKRTLLFGAYVNERLLLRLPHRQMVFTLPKVLRVFFRHDRNLVGEIGAFPSTTSPRPARGADTRSCQALLRRQTRCPASGLHSRGDGPCNRHLH
jgi:hypothetical protein